MYSVAVLANTSVRSSRNWLFILYEKQIRPKYPENIVINFIDKITDPVALALYPRTSLSWGMMLCPQQRCWFQS